MNANTAAKQAPGPKPPPPFRLRDNQTFIALYGQILGGLYSKLKPPPYYDQCDLHDECSRNAGVAYVAACHAFRQLELAEPPDSESEVEQFNQTINHHTN